MAALGLLGLAVIIGAILGWIAFFRSLSHGNELRMLRIDIKSLEAKLKEQSPRKDNKAYAAPSFETKSPAQPAPVIPEPQAADIHKAADEIAVEKIVSAAAPAPEETPAPDDASAHQSAVALEKSLTGNWLIWLGGAALALGGAFLLKSAIDAGFFGPMMRVIAALLAGGAMIAAGEWGRRTRLDPKSESKDNIVWRNSIAPAVLAGAGGSTIYGAIFAAYGVFDLLPSVASFVLLVAACGGMLVLAVLHRAPAVAGLGLIGAYLSPILTASGDPAVNALFLYVFGVSAAGLLVARIMSWRSISYVALAGGFTWPLIWLAGAGDAAIGLYIYLPAYLALAGFVAWDDAKEPLDVNRFSKDGLGALPVSLIGFHIASLAALTLALLFSLKFGEEQASAFMWAGFGVLTLAGASRREAFSPTPVFVMLAVVLATILSDDGDAMAMTRISFGFAILFALGGYAVMHKQNEKGPIAIVAGFGPVLLVAAQYYLTSHFQSSPAWALTSFALIFVNIGMLMDLRNRAGSFEENPGAVSAFIVGATLASSLAIAIAFDNLMMSAGLAIQAPVMAWLWLRFRLPALKYGAAALAVLSSVRLLLLPEIADYSFGGLPLVNMLIPGYLAPAAGFWVAARWFEKGGLSRTARIIQGLEGGAIALFAAFVSLQIRHLMNDGDIGGSRFSLLEVSLQTINWVSISAFLRWRFGGQLTSIRRLAELALISLAGFMSFAFALVTANPWWGENAPEIAGPPIFNLLLVAYFAPALAFGAAAYVTRRSGAVLQSRIAGLFAALLGFVWFALNVRYFFHAPDLSRGNIGSGESWAYSIATISYAVGFLIVGAYRKSAILRFAGLGVLMLAVFKVFLFDAAGLDGVWRASSFLGLGAALIGIAVLYQRLTVLEKAQEEAGFTP